MNQRKPPNNKAAAEDPPPYCCFDNAVPVLTVSVNLDEFLLPADGDAQADTDALVLVQWIHTFYVEVDSMLAEFPDLWRFSTMHCTFSLAPLLPLSSNDKICALVTYAQRLMHVCKQVRLLRVVETPHPELDSSSSEDAA